MRYPLKAKTLDEAVKRYGPLSPGKWNDEAKWMTVWTAPTYFSDVVDNGLTGGKCLRIYMNKDMVEPFTQAVQNLKDAGILEQFKSFDGCFNLRDKRGLPGQPSTHSYGLALDINAPENCLGTEGRMTPEFIKCFEDAGFIWGGRWKRKDPMHFQFVGF